jgi:hypothetical protein
LLRPTFFFCNFIFAKKNFFFLVAKQINLMAKSAKQCMKQAGRRSRKLFHWSRLSESRLLDQLAATKTEDEYYARRTRVPRRAGWGGRSCLLAPNQSNSKKPFQLLYSVDRQHKQKDAGQIPAA